MLSALTQLALEVKYLDRARDFYAEYFDLDPVEATESEVVFEVGETRLVLRRPDGVPRGGLHVHYAFATGADAYETWEARLSALPTVAFDFGGSRSLYVDDPDDHCVEVGTVSEQATDGLVGVFELVLEVESLAPAVERYQTLGFEVVDRGGDRRRVRLRGPMDLELWEPQLGIADARGGVHVDARFAADDPVLAAEAVAPEATVETVDGGVRVREADGHVLTFVDESRA
ncbi:VOC family protein [Salinigranum halophilum]|uniref:VOC family protein n=1 Tax=Salinigranum halophilum TaxID=2565931 RepID=UPI00115DA0F3|nr:VOC family protein [Salinigranum halophilum]